MMLCEAWLCTDTATFEVTPQGTSYSVYSCPSPMCLRSAKDKISKDFPGRPVSTKPFRG